MVYKNRVVCCLTTRPSQPYYFNKVLDSLVKQFDAVYLSLPYVSCKGIKYEDMEYPGVIVTRVDEDYGPITKFFGALDIETDPNTVIVAVDDDIIYDAKFRDAYEKASIKYPNYVLSGAGIVYKYYTLCDKFPWWFCFTGRRENYPFFLPSLIGDYRTQTVAGYSGICFKKKMINKKSLLQFIKNNTKSNICFVNDDIVISAFFSRKNIERRCVSIPRCIHNNNKHIESLSNNNIMDTQYKAFKELQQHFQYEPFRFDCVVLLDIIILVVLFKWYTIKNLIIKV